MKNIRKILNYRVSNKAWVLPVGIVLTWIFMPYLLFAQVVIVPSTEDKARIVLSPYAQSVPNDSYTFMSINHPSLDTALTQVGVALEVRGMTTVPDNVAGRAAIFTVDAGETHRVFIVNVSNSTINSSNASFTDARTHLILTQDSAQFGNIRAVAVNEVPLTPTTVGTTQKYNNLGQLSFWGVVFVESSGTGFSMEFIGDAHDSTIGRNFGDSQLDGVSGSSSGVARGIN
ncbi:MAG: hypothetical protein HOF21_14895 [Nitrospina sp.]|nr:hypothetical protein [Nitrospina sp.]MBT5631310.1 hypothetical protein [Nitrospina sp.]